MHVYCVMYVYMSYIDSVIYIYVCIAQYQIHIVHMYAYIYMLCVSQHMKSYNII